MCIQVNDATRVEMMEVSSECDTALELHDSDY